MSLADLKEFVKSKIIDITKLPYPDDYIEITKESFCEEFNREMREILQKINQIERGDQNGSV